MSRITEMAEKNDCNWKVQEIELLLAKCYFSLLFRFVLFTLCEIYSEIASLRFLSEAELL